MYVFLYAWVHTRICMHVWLRLFQTLVDAIKVLLKVWQLSVCIVIIHMILMNGSQFSSSKSIEDDFSLDGVRPDFNNVQHICVLASCLFLSLTFLFSWVLIKQDFC
jgi:preprotein translocase subunit SecG